MDLWEAAVAFEKQFPHRGGVSGLIKSGATSRALRAEAMTYGPFDDEDEDEDEEDEDVC